MGIKKVLKNKKMGDIVTSFTMPLLTIVFVSILLFMFLNTTKQDKIADDLDRMGRKYILQMETDGYLTAGNKNKLISSLESIGVKNISLAGTTMQNVAYGSEIDLMISCDVEVENITMEGFKIKKKIDTVRYSDTWSSTAKN